MAEQFWAGVILIMESAAATAVTIDGISKANPAVVSYTGTDPSNGDIVRITAPGMVETDERLFRVANVDTGADTFELEGHDSSNENDFASGEFEVLTFGTTVDELTEISPAGGEPVKTTYQFLEEKVQREKTVGRNATSISITKAWNPANASAAILRGFDGLTKAFLLTFEGGQKYYFNGEVSFLEAPLGAANELVTTSLEISSQGKGTAYGT